MWNGVIGKSAVSIKNNVYNHKNICQCNTIYNYKMTSDLSAMETSKKLGCLNWPIPKRIELLRSNALTRKEQVFVITQISKYIDWMQSEEFERNPDKLVGIGYISPPNKLKMKFFKACFMGEDQGFFVKQLGCLSRKQLYDHNSTNREKMFYKATTKLQ